MKQPQISSFKRLCLEGEGRESPTPDGFISGRTLIECTLGEWWGTDFADMTVEGFDLASNSTLRIAAQNGQITDCADLIRQACKAGKLRPSIAADKEMPDARHLLSYPADELNDAAADRFMGDLVLGEVVRIGAQPETWANGRPLLFREDDAVHWLASLRSPMVWRTPRTVSPELLLGRPYVWLSECVTWLAARSRPSNRPAPSCRSPSPDYLANGANP